MTGVQRAGATVDPRRAAELDFDSVVELTRRLVQIPSRAGIDPSEPILGELERWFGQRGMPVRRLKDSGGLSAAVVCEVEGGRPGPRYVLDACVDTAPFGNEAAWMYPPLSGTIEDGWLYGRGSSDSKVGVAIFSHLAAHVIGAASSLRGTLTVLFDADEHSGGFLGARTYFEGQDAPGDVAGVMIGYPGPRSVVVGGRGILRVRLDVYGVAGHSAGRQPTSNAITKAAELVTALSHLHLPDGTTEDFPPPPKLTVTAIGGGEGYSVVPDVCRLNVDVRLTPSFDADAAEAIVRRAVVGVDGRWPGTRETSVAVEQRWPPFRLREDCRLSRALLDAASEVGLPTEPKVAGPSNIGNYLASLGIDATAGFGVEYQNLHGTDECIRLDTIPAVQAAYHIAILELLS
jgi:succinyl-diaminopimelate desuccinylase